MGRGFGVRALVLRVLRAGKRSQAPDLETRPTTRQDPAGKGEGAPREDRHHLAGTGHRGSQTLSHWAPLLRTSVQSLDVKALLAAGVERLQGSG